MCFVFCFFIVSMIRISYWACGEECFTTCDQVGAPHGFANPLRQDIPSASARLWAFLLQDLKPAQSHLWWGLMCVLWKVPGFVFSAYPRWRLRPKEHFSLSLILLNTEALYGSIFCRAVPRDSWNRAFGKVLPGSLFTRVSFSLLACQAD